MEFIKFKQELIEEENRAFYGWDFSSLDNRMIEEPLPWDYRKVVLDSLDDSMELLDMGTGGGEFLMTLNHPYDKTSVTEAYPPNIELCEKNLSPLGVKVYAVENDEKLPFDSNLFDIVINRHEAYDVKELMRILKPGGLFITQQVGGLNSFNMAKFLIPKYVPENKDFNLDNELKKFELAGFDITLSDECYPYARFYDEGAFVYFARIISWEYPGFSVEKHFDRLLELENQKQQNGFVEVDEHRFMIAARNSNL